MCLGLTARYEELVQVDQALLQTEQELMAAHLKLKGAAGPRPEALYTEVLGLRARIRQLVAGLGDDLVAGP